MGWQQTIEGFTLAVCTSEKKTLLISSNLGESVISGRCPWIGFNRRKIKAGFLIHLIALIKRKIKLILAQFTLHITIYINLNMYISNWSGSHQLKGLQVASVRREASFLASSVTFRFRSSSSHELSKDGLALSKLRVHLYNNIEFRFYLINLSGEMSELCFGANSIWPLRHNLINNLINGWIGVPGWQGSQ